MLLPKPLPSVVVVVSTGTVLSVVSWVVDAGVEFSVVLVTVLVVIGAVVVSEAVEVMGSVT